MREGPAAADAATHDRGTGTEVDKPVAAAATAAAGPSAVPARAATPPRERGADVEAAATSLSLRDAACRGVGDEGGAREPGLPRRRVAKAERSTGRTARRLC